ncbi:hypothetical protein GRI89_16750 [Altererythrobacter salegens]|uniref:Lipoprotein n=1 Tax=Croceibacterium salegens TaxID=1737568 RepID=A0A6I4SYQ8_9SPHN|nr:hypothetical protein [Croceibacterium salegens]MXO61195.1 hypothetical protein [Croceibacterium salegens]
MNKGFLFVLAAALPLAACTSSQDDYYTESVPPPPPYQEPLPTPVTTAPCPPIGGTWSGAASVGGSVPGLAGATWADANNDGCIDGYVREGLYYSGAPVIQTAPVSYTGERG